MSDSETESSGSSDGLTSSEEEPVDRSKLGATAEAVSSEPSAVFRLGAEMEWTRAQLQSMHADALTKELRAT